jgi:hypothetical protein
MAAARGPGAFSAGERDPATSGVAAWRRRDVNEGGGRDQHGSRRTEEDDGDGATLPPGWEAHVDPSSGKTYFHNLATKETQWDRPAGGGGGASGGGDGGGRGVAGDAATTAARQPADLAAALGPEGLKVSGFPRHLSATHVSTLLRAFGPLKVRKVRKTMSNVWAAARCATVARLPATGSVTRATASRVAWLDADRCLTNCKAKSDQA